MTDSGQVKRLERRRHRIAAPESESLSAGVGSGRKHRRSAVMVAGSSVVRPAPWLPPPWRGREMLMWHQAFCCNIKFYLGITQVSPAWRKVAQFVIWL